MHGHDLTPLLLNPKTAWNHPVLLSLTSRQYGSDTDTVPTDPQQRDLNGVPWWVFLVKDGHKYIRTLVEDEIEELYDLANDPQELTNLALQPAYADRLSEYRAETIAELRRTDAGMVNSLPAVRVAHDKKTE